MLSAIEKFIGPYKTSVDTGANLPLERAHLMWFIKRLILTERSQDSRVSKKAKRRAKELIRNLPLGVVADAKIELERPKEPRAENKSYIFTGTTAPSAAEFKFPIHKNASRKNLDEYDNSASSLAKPKKRNLLRLKTR